MILAVIVTNIVHCEAIFINVNHHIFQKFLKKLNEVLGDDDFTNVMDNVRFHLSTMDFYDDYNYMFRYLPRYSPFLNPCEQVFSKI